MLMRLGFSLMRTPLPLPAEGAACDRGALTGVGRGLASGSLGAPSSAACSARERLETRVPLTTLGGKWMLGCLWAAVGAPPGAAVASAVGPWGAAAAAASAFSLAAAASSASWARRCWSSRSWRWTSSTTWRIVSLYEAATFCRSGVEQGSSLVRTSREMRNGTRSRLFRTLASSTTIWTMQKCGWSAWQMGRYSPVSLTRSVRLSLCRFFCSITCR
mmetsp:Transcript_15643/g.44379  ORF Transcript_15643/g.44379 Transcript_15643/m.44379 type:complete len:217 (-) Transcript_15643:254-904(-)